MLKKTVQQLEKLEDRTLEENVRLCGELEAEALKRQFFRRAAWAVHMLFFSVVVLLLLALFWMEALVEHGQGAAVPAGLRRVIEQGLAAEGLSSQYEAFFILLAVLLFLPVVTDILFAVLARTTPADSLTPEAAAAVKAVKEQEKLDFMKTSIKHSKSVLNTETLTFGGSGGTLLLHGLCIVFSLLFMYMAYRLEYPGELVKSVFGAALWLFLCEMAFLISSLPVCLLFRSKVTFYRAETGLYQYEPEIIKEAEARARADRLAAMTPEERRRFLEEEERQRLLEEERRREAEEEKRREEEDFKRWRASKRCVCRYYNAGSCNHGCSTCYHPYDPENCSTALVSGGLLFVDK